MLTPVCLEGAGRKHSMEKASVQGTGPAFMGLILALHPPPTPETCDGLHVPHIASTLGTTGPWTGTGESPSPLVTELALLTRQLLICMGLRCCGQEVGSEGTDAGTALTCLCRLPSECQPVPLNGEL